MDIEKAIDILKRLRIATATSSVDGDRVLEPLNMAIEALEKQERDKTKQTVVVQNGNNNTHIEHVDTLNL